MFAIYKEFKWVDRTYFYLSNQKGMFRNCLLYDRNHISYRDKHFSNVSDYAFII